MDAPSIRKRSREESEPLGDKTWAEAELDQKQFFRTEQRARRSIRLSEAAGSMAAAIRLYTKESPITETGGKDTEPRNTAVNGIEEEFVCPITKEFFVNPAMGSDGFCYERESLKSWLVHDALIKSPSTGLPMGSQIFPAPKVRILLARLVKEGIIAGEKADTWRNTMREIETNRLEFGLLVAKAEQNDRDAMMDLGLALADGGHYGKEVDRANAFVWLEKAALEGCARSAARVANMLLKGSVCDSDQVEGHEMNLLGAVLGSQHACGQLAHRKAMNCYDPLRGEGVRCACQEATFWYTKMGKCSIKDSTALCLERCHLWLSGARDAACGNYHHE